jgi:hypothetical protein
MSARVPNRVIDFPIAVKVVAQKNPNLHVLEYRGEILVHALGTRVDRRNKGDQTRVARAGWKQVPEERLRSGPYLLPPQPCSAR